MDRCKCNISPWKREPIIQFGMGRRRIIENQLIKNYLICYSITCLGAGTCLNLKGKKLWSTAFGHSWFLGREALLVVDLVSFGLIAFQVSRKVPQLSLSTKLVLLVVPHRPTPHGTVALSSSYSTCRDFSFYDDEFAQIMDGFGR